MIQILNDTSRETIDKLANIVRSTSIDQLIIAGNKPGFISGYFETAMLEAGKTVNDIKLLSFQEYGLVSQEDTAMAQALVECAVKGVSFESAALQGDLQMIPDTLVIGGGITGIQAALEMADGHVHVFLVEKSGTIGGKMATFDKTFPTLDCAACILTPKMVEVNQHPNIDLMTYSEVLDVWGVPGNYWVTVRKKARRVNLSTCIGCGSCSEKCPATAPSEFDAETCLRKAIYIPFPQAVPNKYLIDENACIYLKTGKCKACIKACPVPDCINLDEIDETVKLNVGNIIVATGFKPFDAARMPQFGYGKFPNVVTALEFERLLNAAGSTGGNIHLRSQDKKGRWVFNTESPKPSRIAIIHCVGSRDENYNKYCSRVCCMYSLKFAHLVREKLPESEIYEFYIDMRAFGKGYEEFYQRISREGVHIIRGKTAMIEPNGEVLRLRGEDVENRRLLETEVDMVVLATGLEPSEDAEKICQILGIKRSPDGWFMAMNSNTDPTGTSFGGIYIAGVCQGPKDIPDSVAQGSAAAAKVIQNIIRGKVSVGFENLTPESVLNNANELAIIS
ncbi:MAG: CoB--CoM heterodisulfide reductase iron-sulfur subunit A family protein [Bacteroidales bacterium]|nr:CoB--CoM heterodisulfide reductase iron-sulfur subunit A family protein [Bacteroidales bacterium]